jgi:hypothetical protein
MPSENYQVENLQALCENILEKVYAKFGSAGQFKITSGYRSPRINARFSSSSNSQHTYGQAVDFEIVGISNYTVAKWIQENLDYDQLILEECKNPNDINDGWIHVSYDRNKTEQRKDNFTFAYSRKLPGILSPPYKRLA